MNEISKSYRNEQQERHNWNDEKDLKALSEEHEYSFERNPDYIKDPLMKNPEYRKSIEEEDALAAVQSYNDAFTVDQQIYEEEKGRARTRSRTGSSIIITILVTAVVATAGILTAILMLK